ncbi:HWE histidine kinase domain-containing protein [Roseomonas sp. 18066]|uniref:HWE histidine kinase domain-containing protein n=1 Tax=Roseomonas sp. 18066 TaxID=2681412 RepID=UPI001356BFFC|nr:HWE histidine kinase domain-containing protein [Roseomonas sp. 18066]
MMPGSDKASTAAAGAAGPGFAGPRFATPRDDAAPARPARRVRRPPRFRMQLLRLVLSVTLPLVLLAAALAFWTAHEQRAEVLRGMEHTSRALQLAVDRELRAGIAALDALATSPMLDAALLDEGNGEAAGGFRAQAEALLDRPTSGLRQLVLLLPDPQSPRQVMNTARPAGAALSTVERLEYARQAESPSHDFAQIWARILQQRRPRVSDLYRSAENPAWRIALSLPVLRQQQVVAVLVAVLQPQRIAEVLAEQQPPPGWAATVIDRGGAVVAHSGDTPRFLGRPASQPVLDFQATRGATAAMLTAETRGGNHVYGAIRRLGTVPWSVAYAAPRAEVDMPQWRALALAAIGGLAALGLPALLALRFGRRLGQEVEGLGRDAAAVALAEAPPPSRAAPLIREVAHARLGLQRVGEALHLRAVAKRESEARQALLMREVDHRAKNALAVALSLVRLAPRDVPPANFAASAEGRIAAMARAHSLLARESWDGASLRAVAESELAAHAGRVVLEGPAIRLAATAVQPLAMLLHELATNAVKHGALSTADGHVVLEWERPEGDASLRLVWSERGGPPLLVPPVQQHFGGRLIRQLAERQLGGGLHVEWRTAGLRLTLRLPARHTLPLMGHQPEGAAEGVAPPEPQGSAMTSLSVGPAPRVLLVEDEALLAMEAAHLLRELGCIVVGPARSPAEAMPLVSAQLSAAVLDVKLGGTEIFPIAERLAAFGVPYVFITGYETHDGLAGQAAAVLRKPYRRSELAAAVAVVLERTDSEAAEPG